MNSKVISERFKYNDSDLLYTYTEDQVGEIKKVKAKIRNNEFSLQSTSCPCGGEDYCVIAETERYNLPLHTVICNSCGSLRFKEYLTDDGVSDFYTNNYQLMYGRLVDVPKYFRRQGSYGRRIFESYRNLLAAGSNVLEIGCGAGGALNIFREEGMIVFGCEYSQTLVDYAKSQSLENIYQGALFDAEQQLRGEKFDLIYMHHVFEHISDPMALLRKCKEFLSVNGKLVIGVPDFLLIDQYENPGDDLMPFLHIAHKYNFTEGCFQLMGEQVGMQGNAVSLHKDYQTPWAVQPELWFEFSRPEQESAVISREVGAEVYQYLMSTEAKYNNRVMMSHKSRRKLLHRLKKYLGFSSN